MKKLKRSEADPIEDDKEWDGRVNPEAGEEYHMAEADPMKRDPSYSAKARGEPEVTKVEYDEPVAEGAKDSKGKMRFDLIPVKPLWYLVQVFTFGCKKYDPRNWEKGVLWCEFFMAMNRHAWKWFGGESFDKEGQHHLASVAWHAMALMEFEETHPELDNRPRAVDLTQFDPLEEEKHHVEEDTTL